MSNNFFKASLFSTLSETLSKIVGPLGFVVLTSILSPSDFGIVAVGSSILMIINIIADLGVSKVLIQHKINKIESEKIYNTGFTINLIIGIIFFCFLFLFSKPIANLFDIPESYLIIRLISIQVIFQSISSVQIALRKKAMDFTFLFYLRIVTSFFPLMISIPTAFMGYGYLSIVYSQLITVILSSVILWYFSDWKPKIYFNKNFVKLILTKSIWSSLDEISILIPFILDTYLISNYIDQESLGIYSTSRTLYRSFFTLLLGSLSPVIFSFLSKIKSDKLKFNFYLLELFKVSSFIVIVSGLFVTINSEVIEFILFDDDWRGISSVIGILFSIMSLTYISASLEDAIRSMGLFKKLAINRVIITFFSFLVLIWAVSYGLNVYIFLRSTILLVLIPLNLKIIQKEINLKTKSFLGNIRYLIVFYLVIVLFDIIIKKLDGFLIKIILSNSLYLTFILILFYWERRFLFKYFLKFNKKIKWKKN